MKKTQAPDFKERSFGVSVGGVLVAVAAYLAWRERYDPALVVGGTGAALVVLGLRAPRLLKWPAALWWKLAMVLGYVNARVILTIAFVVVLSPIGVLWRIIGHDPLGRRRKNWHGWSPSPERFRSPDHFNRMY
jgi:hypothetical protein